jgi:hypothetical protein
MHSKKITLKNVYACCVVVVIHCSADHLSPPLFNNEMGAMRNLKAA